MSSKQPEQDANTLFIHYAHTIKLISLVLEVQQIMLRSDNLTLQADEHLGVVIWLSVNLCQPIATLGSNLFRQKMCLLASDISRSSAESHMPSEKTAHESRSCVWLSLLFQAHHDLWFIQLNKPHGKELNGQLEIFLALSKSALNSLFHFYFCITTATHIKDTEASTY